MELLECLNKIGFTGNESILYFTLCSEGELTGYEAAKISGIPRSNAYLALAGLVEKGGVYKIESDSVKYVAVPVRELVSNYRRQYNEVLDFLEHNSPERNVAVDLYITISGRTHIINKMKNIIEHASERIYVSMSSIEIEFVKNELENAISRGLKVVIITSAEFSIQGSRIYSNTKELGQIRLIADSTEVLTGEVSDKVESTCLYSKNKNLIQLIKDSLTNEIKLIEINKR